jgi:hypothetical protein
MFTSSPINAIPFFIQELLEIFIKGYYSTNLEKGVISQAVIM